MVCPACRSVIELGALACPYCTRGIHYGAFPHEREAARRQGGCRAALVVEAVWIVLVLLFLWSGAGPPLWLVPLAVGSALVAYWIGAASAEGDLVDSCAGVIRPIL